MNAKNIEIFADVELLYEAAASRIIALANECLGKTLLFFGAMNVVFP
jgi:hypothetical protein